MSAPSNPFTLPATLLAATCGAFLFHAFGLPAAFISGAMVGTVLLMAFGLRPRIPDALRDAGMLLAGGATGSSITREMLAVLGHYPLSLVLLIATTFAVTFGGALLLRRLFRWDPWSALYAAVPGALSAVLGAAGETAGSMARIVAAQSFRLFVMVALLPSLILKTAPVRALAPGAELAAGPFALLVFTGFALGACLRALHVMTPWFLGGMGAAALFHLGGVMEGLPPPPVNHLALLLIGVFAASRLVGASAATLRALWLPCLVLLFSSTGIGLLGGYAAHALAGVPLAEALVAFAPGGLEAMVALGLALGLDPLYVTSHHVARFVLISVALPFVGRRVPGAAGWRRGR